MDKYHEKMFAEILLMPSEGLTEKILEYIEE